ncbi:hypothetical protein EAS64_22950 [Trebonia kvetii]|uniref:Glyoxalase-like domain-containing protein n=1 Tax=Trebonia kvetii TaxID=2480626 RepID=A0A6P2BYH1_9ACTN|nr:VOC family protein [Trebonia kvetii]TVZ03281.1 hypothetical protein EAS64_22950 [Trebonia kvetii]
MAARITYYAIADDLSSPEEPVGVLRRVERDVGRFWSAAADPEVEITRLVEMGATRVADHDEYGYTWTLMADPEGNEFDLGKAL